MSPARPFSSAPVRTPICSSSRQAISRWSGAAMSAIEQPGAKGGRTTCCGGGRGGRGQNVGPLRHEMDAAEDDVFGGALVGRRVRELQRVAGEIGELDD